MPPAFSASRAGATQEASGHGSSGTFGKDMKRLAAFLVLLLTASAHADTADSLPEGMTRLGPKMRDVAPVLDKLMERNSPDERLPHYTVWTLYGQNDTSVYLTHDSKGNICGALAAFF